MTFFVAVAVVSLAGYFGFGKLAANSYDFETQKIYAVLVKDAQIRQERFEKNGEYAKGKGISSVNPSFLKINWLVAARATNEIDTRQVPNEFERAWRKYANAETKSAEAFSNLPLTLNFNIDSVENRTWYSACSERKQAWSEVVSIAKSYGLKFDQHENFITENHSEN